MNANNLSQIPGDISPLFESLHSDLRSLHLKWEIYKDLFPDVSKCKILSGAAKTFFISTEEAFRDSMVMAFGRLSDPMKSAGRENASFKQIADKCKEIAGVTSLVDNFDSEVKKSLKKLRNKTVGHSDYLMAVQPNENEVSTPPFREINKAIELGGRILNTIHVYFTGGDISCKTLHNDGVDRLIYILKKGLEEAD